MNAEIKNNDLRDRTKRFAPLIIRMFAALPKTVEAQVTGKQVLRSGSEISIFLRFAFVYTCSE